MPMRPALSNIRLAGVGSGDGGGVIKSADVNTGRARIAQGHRGDGRRGDHTEESAGAARVGTREHVTIAEGDVEGAARTRDRVVGETDGLGAAADNRRRDIESALLSAQG